MSKVIVKDDVCWLLIKKLIKKKSCEVDQGGNAKYPHPLYLS